MFELLGGDKLTTLLWPLVVATPRIFGFWFGFPMIASNSFPELVRGGATLAFALFAWPITASAMPNPLPSGAAWLFIVPKELLIGYCFGVGLGVIVWALESVGTIIDSATGANNAAQMDPASGAPLGPTGVFLRQYAIALILTSGVFGQYLVALIQSLTVWPWHASWPDTSLLGKTYFDVRSAHFWTQTLRLAVPVMFALLLVEIGLGMINRTTPSFDVYRFGMSLKSLLAAMVMAITAVFWSEALVQLYREDAAFVLKALGGMGATR